jgi:hypothetical protein
MSLHADCQVKIRPFPDGTELVCELADSHDMHEATLRDYAYPGSRTRITWLHDDRRCVTGEWVECAHGNCVLPNGHPGRCAA